MEPKIVFSEKAEIESRKEAPDDKVCGVAGQSDVDGGQVVSPEIRMRFWPKKNHEKSYLYN